MRTNKSVTIQVNGMHCGGCAGRIKKVMEELKVDKTEIDVSSGSVKVQFDGTKTSVSDIKANITAAGFQVESVNLE